MAINHTISVLVTNEVGVLSRIVDLFSGRGYNIESLTVAPTLDSIYSRVTIVTRADNDVIEQICKQLNRLIPVIKVANLTIGDAIEYEIGLLKISVNDENRAEFMNIVAQAQATIMDVNEKTYTVKIDGDEKKVQTFAELVRPFGIKEFVRSGKVAITKSGQFSNFKNKKEEIKLGF
ncbi:MAG: acetolactate synthase small subunit [Candidatus Gastranaerophilales bacterium]|nr:acetolactate synthase small subunit [Candidatus Gastranaerophilales bacterium]